ncbi:MAG TPA: ribosome biogenesis GTPase Der [Verrucomicrobiae bacterium]|nr:ribosome biogenesis GTPase Der [Verrucomicrobiae bacterium]
MNQRIPRVALVGRPNVGKSTLFNRLLGARFAVVADIAGTTRDRLERTITWEGHSFVVVDMAGLEPALNEKNEIREGMQRQVQAALDTSDVVLWVVDSIEGATGTDRIIAELLRRLGKPVVVAANKCDHEKHEITQLEFAEFGFDPVCPISAMHDRGTENLLKALIAVLPEEGTAELVEDDDREIKIAITGRPNVGKSTLLNSLVGEERSVVSPEAGTTRDSVDTIIPAENLFQNIFTRWKTVRIVDTAGIRRRGKIDRSIEGWSVLRSYDAIDAADVTLLLIDAPEGLVHQDTQVIERLLNAGKPLVLLVNKWDLILAKKSIIAGTEEDELAQEKFLDELRYKLSFVNWAQVLFLSAQTGLYVDVIGRLVNNAYVAWSKEIDQDELNALTKQLRTMPRLNNLRKITFEHSKPPVFHIHTHGMQLPHFSTRRYVENALRDYFNLGPTPIKIWVKRSNARGEEVEDKD